MLLEMLAMTKKPLSQLLDNLQKEFGRSAYDRIDMHFPLEKRQHFIESLGLLAVVDGSDQGLVLIDLNTIALAHTPFF